MNIYATDGSISKKNLDLTSTSTFTGAIPAPTVRLLSIAYSDASGLDKLKIKSGTHLEFRDGSNVALFDVDATNGFRMWRNGIFNDSVIAGARNIGAYNNSTVGNEIIATYTIACQHLEVSQTSTFTGDISAPHIYNKMKVNELLTEQCDCI